MRTVAEVLVEARTKFGYSLDEVQRLTKIRKNILEALEQGDYDALPPPTFIKGFIKNYGELLSLDVEELLALFRREYDERKNPKITQTKFSSKRFVITPGIIIAGFVILITTLFIGYLYQEYQSFAAPPFLVVEEPQNNLKTNKTSVSVVGRTDPDAELKINGQKINIGVGGIFSQEININGGTNVLTLTATNKLGKITTLERIINVEIPKPPPLPVPPPSAQKER